MDDDALLQMAIERSLLDSDGNIPINDGNISSDQVTLYEALGHSGARGNRPDISNRYVDYDLQRYKNWVEVVEIWFDFCFCRALEASLLTSGLSEAEMEEIRKQNQEQLGIGGGAEASVQDLSTVMELSKRDEEARLNRLREEE